jgi:hypothetical protein
MHFFCAFLVCHRTAYAPSVEETFVFAMLGFDVHLEVRLAKTGCKLHRAMALIGIVK